MSGTDFQGMVIRRMFDGIKNALFDEIKPRMLKAMEDAFDEAWDAAMRRVAESPVGDQPTIQPGPTAAPEPTKPVISKPKPPSNVETRAPWGTTNAVIKRAFGGVKGGLTPKQIADWGASNDMKVAPSSVRTALQRMQKDGQIRRRKDKYFLAKVPSEIGASVPDGEDAPGPDTVLPFRGAAA